MRAPEVRFDASEIGLEAFGYNIENRHLLAALHARAQMLASLTIVNAAADHILVEADKVTENASFIDDLGADSLDTVELVMAFEEEFGVEIPDDAAESIVTVGDAVKFIKEKAAA